MRQSFWGHACGIKRKESKRLESRVLAIPTAPHKLLQLSSSWAMMNFWSYFGGKAAFRVKRHNSSHQIFNDSTLALALVGSYMIASPNIYLSNTLVFEVESSSMLQTCSSVSELGSLLHMPYWPYSKFGSIGGAHSCRLPK